MKLIVGLGNPGAQYEKTRHNSGFMAIQKLAEKCNASNASQKFNARVAIVRIQNEQVLLMEPTTFMNESGQAVIQAVNYYHIDTSDILVMHDDMDLPVGAVRIREKGSSGGQKGMKSIIEHLHTENIARIRIGIDHDTRHDVPDYVLSPVSKSEWPQYEEALNTAAEAAYAWITTPMQKVMSLYNTKPSNVVE